MLERLPRVLNHSSLESLEQRLQGPAALAAVQAATAVAEALPLLRSAGMDAGLFIELHTNAALLLGACTEPMVGQPLAEQDGSSGSMPAAATARPASSDEHRQQAAWRLVGLVPRLTSGVQALADDPDAATAYPGDPDAWSRSLDMLCTELACALRLLSCLERQPASTAQLSSWVAAATAGRRLQPLLLRLDASWQQRGLRPHGDGANLDGAQQLSATLLKHLWHNMPSLWEQDAAAVDSYDVWHSLALPLWELHSTAARLYHFLVSRGSSALAGDPSAVGHTELWVGLLTQLERFLSQAAKLLAHVC